MSGKGPDGEVDEDQNVEALNILLKNRILILYVSSSGERGRVPSHGIVLLTREVEKIISRDQLR